MRLLLVTPRADLVTLGTPHRNRVLEWRPWQWHPYVGYLLLPNANPFTFQKEFHSGDNNMESHQRDRLGPSSIFNMLSNERLSGGHVSPTPGRNRPVPPESRSIQNALPSGTPPLSGSSLPSSEILTCRRRPRVRFHPDVRGRTFEVDTSERQHMWYSPEDMRALQGQTRADVKLLRQMRKKQRRSKVGRDGDGDSDNATSPLTPDEQMVLDDTPIRGIEQFVSKRTWADRMEKQRAAIHAVLDEQAYLKEIGRSADDIAIQRIASVSSNFSLEARRRASALGRQDADDIGAETRKFQCRIATTL